MKSFPPCRQQNLICLSNSTANNIRKIILNWFQSFLTNTTSTVWVMTTVILLSSPPYLWPTANSNLWRPTAFFFSAIETLCDVIANMIIIQKRHNERKRKADIWFHYLSATWICSIFVLFRIHAVYLCHNIGLLSQLPNCTVLANI